MKDKEIKDITFKTLAKQTKSSLLYCQEKFACSNEKTNAEYECDDCNSKQCGLCELEIHKRNNLQFHDRKVLPKTPVNLLCQFSCENRNYADLFCKNCELRFCFICDVKMHKSGRKKQHNRTQIKSLTDSSQKSVESCSQNSTAGDETSETFFSLSLDSSCQYSSLTNRTIPDVANMINSKTEISNYYAQHSLDTDDSMKSLDSLQLNNEVYKDCQSVLLADQGENLTVQNDIEFVNKLGCSEDTFVKVVSIFGNTGDGKSHTLNHTFFGGKEVFSTSADQLSCTIGVWAAYDPVHSIILIDTEGLLGITTNQNQRTRLLLKVLAISDIVIYRSRADRLHNDLFQFLGDASKAYTRHFTNELKAASKRFNLDIPLSTLGPAVIIFHETQHTHVLGHGSISESSGDFLKKRFYEMKLDTDAFCSLEYVGTQTTKPPTDFTGLLLAIKMQLRDNKVRSPRNPKVIFNALKILNHKFNGNIDDVVASTFPDQYFTCTSACLSCGARCVDTMNHEEDDRPHIAEKKRCKFQHQFDNKVYTCKSCHERGKEILVIPKTAPSTESSWLALATYAWSGYVLECSNCGVIFRSRQYWYGNQDPVKTVVRTEIRHVWPGGNPCLQGTHNAARRLLDGINFIGETISSVSARPAKKVGNWVTDQVAPPYWIPNSQITHCQFCKSVFNEKNTIHHCRACGHGFCEECSSHKRAVPEKGWGSEPVRVCDRCFSSTAITDNVEDSTDSEASVDNSQLTARKVTEVVSNAIGAVSTAIDYPLDVIKDSSRPNYWVPDHEIISCCVCEIAFSPKITKHHCRACGRGVCLLCSPVRRPVPSRGWDHPVRVCVKCDEKQGKL